MKSNGQKKPAGSSSFNKLKVEMQTLQISVESERQLYETLKQIYGAVSVIP